MLHSSTLARRFRVCLLLVYALLCLTSIISGLGFDLYPPYGYLRPLELSFARFARSVTNQTLSEALVLVDYLLIVVFGAGMLASFLLLTLLSFVLVLMRYTVVSIHQATGGSLTESIVVYSLISLTLVILLRRHWPAVMEGIAWILVWMEGIWKLFFTPRVPAMAYASARAGNRFRSQGEFAMARKNDDEDVDLVALEKAFQDELEPPDISTGPLGMLGAFRHKIKSHASAKAYKEEAEMLRGANEVAKEKLTNFQLKTDSINAPGKRIVQFVQQKLEVLQKAHELKDYLAGREEKARQPRNLVEREYQTEYLPRQTGELRKPIDEAKIRAQRVLEAAAERKKLEMEIDSNDLYTPEEKAALKQKIRKQFQDILGDENA